MRENPWSVVLVVVVCALLVFVFFFVSHDSGGEDSRPQAAKRQCKELHDKAMMWEMIHRKPPGSLDEMVAPLKQDDDENFLDSVPDDPWGHPYVLEVSLYELRVRSSGPDGKKGTEDDIVYAGE